MRGLSRIRGALKAATLLKAATVLYAITTSPVLAVENPDGVAVIIGNKGYQGGIPAVDFAHNDAEAFKQFVVEGLGFDPDNIIDLRDASQAQMESAFGNDRTHKGALWRYLDPDGNSDVVVFYSGHGVPSLEDEQAYLLPVDADPNVPQINGYPLDVLYKNLAKLEARSVKVFLDACFSGNSQNGMLIRATSGISVTARLPEQASQLLVLTAAQGDQVASWDEDAQHGLFTKHLLAALAGAADQGDMGDGNGDVTLAEVKAYLDRHMTRAARRIYGRVQTVTALGGGDVVLATYAPGEVAQPTAETDTTPSASTDSAFDERELDLAFWESIKDSTSVADYEAYLETFPDGVFVRLARNRVVKIVAMEEAQSKTTQDEADRLASEEEAERLAAEEEASRLALEEAQRKAAKEEAERRATEEEASRLALEEAQREAAEEEASRLALEEAQRKAAEEEAERRATEEEASRLALEEAQREAAEEEAERRAAEEEANRLALEEVQREAAEAEAERLAAEEEASRLALEVAQREAAEEEAERLAAEEAQREADKTITTQTVALLPATEIYDGVWSGSFVAEVLAHATRTKEYDLTITITNGEISETMTLTNSREKLQITGRIDSDGTIINGTITGTKFGGFFITGLFWDAKAKMFSGSAFKGKLSLSKQE